MKDEFRRLLLAIALLAGCARSGAPVPLAEYELATAERGTLALVVEARA